MHMICIPDSSLLQIYFDENPLQALYLIFIFVPKITKGSAMLSNHSCSPLWKILTITLIDTPHLDHYIFNL